jgi:hypothetical protein
VSLSLFAVASGFQSLQLTVSFPHGAPVALKAHFIPRVYVARLRSLAWGCYQAGHWRARNTHDVLYLCRKSGGLGKLSGVVEDAKKVLNLEEPALCRSIPRLHLHNL